MMRTILARTLVTLLTFVALSLPAISAPSTNDLLHQHTRTVIEDAALSGSGHELFASTLLGSDDWQHELWDSGPVDQPDATVRALFNLWKNDPKLATNPVDRKMATACALEGPRRNWTSSQVAERYEFFRDKWKSGHLNVAYKDLNVFDRRYLAHGVQHLHLNGIASMEYQNQEICLPAERYTGACWYASWILHNPFGDSVHGPNYYRPFDHSWSNAAEMIRNVGGVCGSLSNFGAAAAIANGIPAVTMGEPGHCAYAVRTEPGKWTPAYSLSWQRGVHTAFNNNGSWGWHVLNAKAYESRSNSNEAGDLRRLTAHYLDAGDSKNAQVTIRDARTKFPGDWLNWSMSVDVLTDTKAATKEWQTLHQDVIKQLAPISGEVAFHVLDKHIYDKVLPKGAKSAKQRRAILLTYQNAFNDWGLGRWNFNHALDRQLKLLGADAKAQDAFMVTAFVLHAKENVFSPIVLEEQLKRVGDDQVRSRQFIAGISRALSKTGDDDSYQKVIESMAAKVLPDAASRGDKEAFQFIGKLTAKYFDPINVSPDPFPGIALSTGGTFGITKPGNRWDSPARHWGVIDASGGVFHTDHKPATATVQLGNFGRLTGVVIVVSGGGGNHWRMENAILQVSTDGTDWTDVHTFKKKQQVYRVDLSGKDIDAGFVRVIQPNHNSLHFHKFHVYGHKQN